MKRLLIIFGVPVLAAALAFQIRTHHHDAGRLALMPIDQEPPTPIIPELRLDRVPLDQAIEQIGARCGRPVVVEWEQLETQAIDRKTPVSLLLFNQPTATSLRLLFEALQLLDADQLQCCYKDGAFRVSTRQGSNTPPKPPPVIVREYDVAELIAALPQPPVWEEGAVIPPGRGCFPSPAMLLSSGTELAAFIETTFDPPSWDPKSRVNAIHEWGSKLWIVASPGMHRQIGDFFVRIRKVTDAIRQNPEAQSSYEFDFPPAEPAARSGPLFAVETTPKPIEPLARPISHLEIRADTFTAAIRKIQDASHANIVLDLPALQAAGIDPDQAASAASFTLIDSDVAKALDLVIALYAGQHAHLGYQESNGIIRISTEDGQANRALVETRVYDIQDFTERFLRPRHAVVKEVPYGSVSAWVDSSGDPVETRQELIDTLVRCIEELVVPDTWRDNGGQQGALKELGGLLIVTQTPENHRKLQNLLTNLRTVRARIDRHEPPTTRPIDLVAEPQKPTGGAKR